MNPKILIGFFAIFFVVFVEVSGRSCSGCGFGPGVDYCNSNPYPVRPVALQPTKTKCVARPVGDVCNCQEVKVKPISIPRPKCIYKEKKTRVPCDSRPLIPAPDYLHDFSQDVDTFDTPYYTDESPCGTRPLYPVDAVSISLVNRLQDSLAASLPEEKLQYGFYKIPKDIPVFKHIPNVPEEKLFTVERQIVELKSPKQLVKCNTGCDEEVILEDKEVQPVAYLSYRDLGYVPEEASAPTFITSCIRKSSKPTKYVQYDSSSSEECDRDDYKYRVVQKSKSCCE